MTYSYEAKDREGRSVSGSLDASDEAVAARQVRSLGYFPIRLAPAGRQNPSSSGAANAQNENRSEPRGDDVPGGPLFRWIKTYVLFALVPAVGITDLAMLYRQWGAMLSAGVPMYQSLMTLVDQTSSGTLRRSLHGLAKGVQSGETLSQTMARYPWIYSSFQRSLVSAGETTGGLDIVFARLAGALEQDAAVQRNIRKESTYPIIVLILTFLLPPLFYLFIGGVGLYIQNAVIPLLALCAGLLGFYVINRLGSQAKLPYHTITASLPALGPTVRMIAFARFARALASLYAAGVAAPRAIGMAADVCGNVYLGSRIKQAIPRIEAGVAVPAALAATNAFPAMVLSMLGTGDHTGNLDSVMDRVADYYEQESALKLHVLCAWTGASLLVGAGIWVAVTVVHFYTGYFAGAMTQGG